MGAQVTCTLCGARGHLPADCPLQPIIDVLGMFNHMTVYEIAEAVGSSHHMVARRMGTMRQRGLAFPFDGMWSLGRDPDYDPIDPRARVVRFDKVRPSSRDAIHSRPEAAGWIRPEGAIS